jgi:hypothetical protein
MVPVHHIDQNKLLQQEVDWSESELGLELESVLVLEVD